MALSLDCVVLGVIGGAIAAKLMKIKRGGVEVSINIAEDSDWDIFRRIQQALARSPRILRLELLGIGLIHPNVMLAIHDLLLNKSPKTDIHVAVRTNIADSSLLFLIHAQKIEIRRDAWFQVATVEELNDCFDDAGSWKRSLINTANEPMALTDYRTVTGILNQYLPLKEFSKKRMPLESTLKDFGIGQQPQDEEKLSRWFKQ